ncbi:Nitrilase/cyanide hydratase and apolipoprotein N-acyltransferase [Acidithiobacillus ferrivorans SS3]|uniref:Nitrilase/cyanide hydratase and apolipoprotein N-acyltransferase n=1 Tax=Acidithiobacillus ferrivorans SS3 TaxID=743299 RepID=G0JNP6_9PROT|nr:carbon-nitrogen hydrolase family protein [Acidithiobacillus ferrivorans]AEM48385.1 Nitrilase/cyanide hydratase and apolipoprotein N-acyltransferase [Acidithiobacillus ferrivorans SS3]MBU2850558.1 carbon-nitrogen hydrolase family protein [Acidithiobacillus ferrivorans]OFA16822.1 apolipoprotein acyltransferase [Acidithiobacillus ferrivorans]
MKVQVAVVQMVSSELLADNLAHAESLLVQAAMGGAQLVLLPENFALMGRDEKAKLAIMEMGGDGPIQSWLAAQAQRLSLWLVGGSIPLAAPDGRCYAACLVFDPAGQCQARYDKIHLFDVDLAGGESYRESRTVAPGSTPVAVTTPWGQLGLSVCYDLRFPELYRSYAGAELLVVPSAFTQQTGAAHWECLLRARAIENQAYVLAADQGGLHQNGRQTFGGSMIIDPWGQVLARLDQGEGVALAQVDMEFLRRCRSNLPALQHRRRRQAFCDAYQEI